MELLFKSPYFWTVLEAVNEKTTYPAALMEKIDLNSNSLYKCLKNLIELGLIEENFQREGRIRRSIAITNLGKQVLNEIELIGKLLENK